MSQKICITGADGFIGKNLILYLSEYKELELLKITKQTPESDLINYIIQSDAIIHLAGVNRPDNESEFEKGNTDFTKKIIDFLSQNDRKIPFIFTSSSQVELDNAYGLSKRSAEAAILEYNIKTKAPIRILRLPGVFGKFCKPNYNSVVATFCYNIARGLEIQINDSNKEISLVYIDSVIKTIAELILKSNSPPLENHYVEVEPIYQVTLGDLANTIYSFAKTRTDLSMGSVGNGFLRALYSTYISYLTPESWSYEIPKYSDSRGVFVEMLKTQESGQFSYFTAPPGLTRGEHYHHTKTEKFLVIKGCALFRFRNKITSEFTEIKVSGDKPTIVDTIPGWAHDITNIGNEEMIVMLWANEVFDRDNPDTYSSVVL